MGYTKNIKIPLANLVNISGFIALISFCVIFYQIIPKSEITLYTFIFMVMIIFYFTRYFEKKVNKYEQQTILEIKDLKIVNKFYNILQSTKGIKDISNVSLEFLSKELDATCATLYISNHKNMKFQLLGVYNLNINTTPKIIDIYSGIKGEAFSSQKIKNYFSKDVNSFAIPLIDKYKTVGVIEVKFFNNIDKLQINEQQNTILKIITTTLVKELEDERNKKYFKLIDKNVLLSSTNTEGEITFVSDAFCKATGYDKKVLIGNTHQILRDSTIKNDVFKDMWKTIKNGKVWQKELPNIKKDGSIYWAKTTITPEFDFYGNIIGYDAIREDITDKKLIEKISITDALTSLYNRRYFDKTFKKQISLAKRIKKSLAFAILDIDHFKQYNDTYGHQAGDQTLKKVANSLSDTLKRDSDFVFRLGGEEFGILYFLEDNEDSSLIANSVIKNIENLKLEHINNSASSYVTISCGLYIYKGENEDCELIYKKADDLLYKAKQNGRNQVYLNIEDKNDK